MPHKKVWLDSTARNVRIRSIFVTPHVSENATFGNLEQFDEFVS